MPVSRRDFLQKTTIASAAVGLSAISTARAADTNDIRVAVIGVNGRGNSHISGMRNNVVAICDVDRMVLEAKAKQFEEHAATQAEEGKTAARDKVDTEVDFRRLLERDDIDAVSIATPNHTHSYIAIEAAQAGKDVYVEKPVSHNVWEGRQLANAARKYGRVIQCGTQARSGKAVRDAVEFVHGGGMGSVRYVVGTCYKPRQSIGKLDQPLRIADHIDYDLWCGPAEKRELFRPRLHYDWHWDLNTGNGDTGNQGIHQMDISRWFLGEDSIAPRVMSIGGRLGYDDAGDTPNSHIVYHDYDKAPLIFETRGLPRSKADQEDWGGSMDMYRGSGVGVIVQCENGYVRCTNYSNVQAYNNDGELIQSFEGGGDHMSNWLEAVAARDPGMLNAEVLEGHLSSALCHTGLIAHRLGSQAPAGEIAERVAHNDLLAHSFDRMASHLRANGVDVDSVDEDGNAALTASGWLEFDPEAEKCTSDDNANQFVSREYRAPYVVPEIA